ncbi:hypothetical protein EF902_31630 [Streptomyces sp. WAC05858]|nr:hypothetical protein EF902_31630 [Streptomyces sp. WAC05858]
MSDAPWTIERISAALGDPDLARRFLAEMYRAPAHELLNTFAKWQRIAQDTVASLEQADEIIACEVDGEEPPGEWIDGDQRVRGLADRIGARGAA